MIQNALSSRSIGLVCVGLLLAASAGAQSAPSIAAPGECAQASLGLETATVNASKTSGGVGGEPGDFFEPSEEPGTGNGDLPGLGLPGMGASSTSMRTSSPSALGDPGNTIQGGIGGAAEALSSLDSQLGFGDPGVGQITDPILSADELLAIEGTPVDPDLSGNLLGGS